MFILLLLVCLALFVGLFAMLEHMDKMRGRLVVTVIVLLVAVGGGVIWLRFQLANTVGCAPDCAGANLVGRDFRQMDLSQLVFAEADLSRSTLDHAQLVNADLSGANLQAANLEGANLSGADLVGANLDGANLSGANLTGADLSGANLTSVSLTGVDLTQTILRSVQFNEADLINVNLAGAKLNAVNFTAAKLNGARLTNANLSGAVLSRADLSGAQLSHSQLNGARLNLTSLIGADLTNSDLSGSSMVAADLASTDLSNSSLVGSNLIGVRLKGANLNDADLRGVRLDVASILTDTDIRLDPTLAELNKLQQSQLLVDAKLDGVTYNGQTVWPKSIVVDALIGAQARVSTEPNPVTQTLKVGLLFDLSGPLADSQAPVRDAVLLSIDQINAAGGVSGFLIEPVLEDSAGDPTTAAAKAKKLLETDKVPAIFSGASVEARKAISPAIDAGNTLLFYTAAYEGFEHSPHTFYVGPDPSQVVIPAVQYLLDQGKKRFLLIGTDAAYAHAVNSIIKAQLAASQLEAAGEVYFPAGATDFSQFVAQLKASPPDVIINLVQGKDNISLFQQLNAAAFKASDLPILNLSLGEEEIRQIGPKIMSGYWVASTYFQTTDSPENFAFVTAYKTAYGNDRVVSAAAAAGYGAVQLWKTLAEKAKSTEPSAILRVAADQDIEYVSPRGKMLAPRGQQQVASTARVGVVRDDGMIDEVYASPAPLPPDPFLTQYPWASTVKIDTGAKP